MESTIYHLTIIKKNAASPRVRKKYILHNKTDHEI